MTEVFNDRLVYVYTLSVVIFYAFFFLMIRRPPRSTLDRSSAASDVYKRQDQHLEKLYQNIEIPLIEVLGDMEKAGFALDMNLLSTLSKKLELKITELTQKIIEQAGEEFNIKSPKQMGPILFEKLKIHEALGIKKIKKTKTGYSTCLLYTSDAADERSSVDLGGRRIIKKKTK